MDKKQTDQELLVTLNDIAIQHVEAMTEVSLRLAELSEATENTLKATRKAINVSKELSLLLLVILGDSKEA